MPHQQLSWVRKQRKRPAVPVELNLVIHAAIDLVHRQGLGIGVVQRTEGAATGAVRNDALPVRQRRYSLQRSGLKKNKVKTNASANMFAILHALRLARWTVNHMPERSDRLHIKKVIVFSGCKRVVEGVNCHAQGDLKSVLKIASTNERSIMKKIFKTIEMISCEGLQTSVLALYEDNQEYQKAKKLARQRGRKACEGRRGSALGYSASGKPFEKTSNQNNLELVLRTKDPSSSSTAITEQNTSAVPRS